jgi:hypothetical protein
VAGQCSELGAATEPGPCARGLGGVVVAVQDQGVACVEPPAQPRDELVRGAARAEQLRQRYAAGIQLSGERGGEFQLLRAVGQAGQGYDEGRAHVPR